MGLLYGSWGIAPMALINRIFGILEPIQVVRKQHADAHHHIAPVIQEKFLISLNMIKRRKIIKKKANIFTEPKNYVQNFLREI